MNDQELDLTQLFAAADQIGDRYLSTEEIDDREATWQAVTEEIEILLAE